MQNNLVVNYLARFWCTLPYPDHRHGCPNFSKRPSCPPEAPLIRNWLQGCTEVSLVVVEFDLAAHMQKMLIKHPQWSERQARCLLYWQPKVDKELRYWTELVAFTRAEPNWTYCPEAMGLDVISTLQGYLPITRNPKDTVFKVSMIRSQD